MSGVKRYGHLRGLRISDYEGKKGFRRNNSPHKRRFCRVTSWVSLILIHIDWNGRRSASGGNEFVTVRAWMCHRSAKIDVSSSLVQTGIQRSLDTAYRRRRQTAGHACTRGRKWTMTFSQPKGYYNWYCTARTRRASLHHEKTKCRCKFGLGMRLLNFLFLPRWFATRSWGLDP